jgi:ABC-type branched-subunit amino acid transport system ATPase component
MTDDALLRAEGITVRFGGVVALEDVDLSTPERAVVGLVGPNGAGKTTLFGVLSGLVRPRRGKVLLRGVDITHATPQRRSHLGLARTFQRIELFTELTVREHLVVARRARERRDRRLFADLVGLGARSSPEERETVDTLLDLLGLAPLADRPAALLPLGTGRLVEVARALATEPAIVLLDEPTSGLDAREAEQLATALERTRGDLGVAFVLVEHNVDFVLELAEYVTVLDFGKMIAAGTPAEIRADPAVQAAYLGTPTGAATG